MKILIITHEYPPIGGGGANACFNLAKEYVKLGHDVTIVTTWFKELLEKENNDNLHIIRLKARRKYLEHCDFPEMLDYLWRALVNANRLQKKVNFDICQVFFAIPSGPVGYYLKKRYRIPYIIRFGGGDIPGFQDRFQLLYKVISPLEKILWKNADALVANSQGLKDLAARFYDKNEIQIITNGVDEKCFYGNVDNKTYKIEKGRKEIQLLFVSRLIERKGLQFFLPMLHEIGERSDKRITLKIVGDGPYRPELEKIVLNECLDERVSFEGQKDKSKLPAYYQSADIFILPSKKEGMPNVVLEAMASGLPVVMTPCEGSKELIHGNGYAVPLAQFTEKIICLCNDDTLRLQMGNKSKQIVKEQFLWEKVAKNYIDLMTRIKLKV